MTRATILVEGASDRIALETIASRQGRDLGAEGVAIVPMDGAHAIAGFLSRIAHAPETVIAGLCDVAEEDVFRRAVERAGLGRYSTRSEMEQRGFYICVQDLEDELIRAAGTATVEDLLDGQGELATFRKFQKQPEWRGRPVDSQLRRFLSNSHRKGRYARLIVEALDLDRFPRPLAGVLEYVASDSVRSKV